MLELIAIIQKYVNFGLLLNYNCNILTTVVNTLNIFVLLGKSSHHK